MRARTGGRSIAQAEETSQLSAAKQSVKDAEEANAKDGTLYHPVVFKLTLLSGKRIQQYSYFTAEDEVPRAADA